jgi:hypothetical protein
VSCLGIKINQKFSTTTKKSRRQVGKRETTFQMAQTNEIKEKKLKINFRIGGGGSGPSSRNDYCDRITRRRAPVMLIFDLEDNK